VATNGFVRARGQRAPRYVRACGIAIDPTHDAHVAPATCPSRAARGRDVVCAKHARRVAVTFNRRLNMTGDDFFAPLPDLPANNHDPWTPAHPSRRARFLRFIVDRNPFYLLSAVCMLVGCILLTNSTSFTPISRSRLLVMLGTLNCYEALLIGLAVWLIATRDLVRDGAILLGIEAFFLVDTTWLNHEIFTIDLRLGVIVSALLMIAATVKLAAIIIGLRIHHGNGAFVLIATQLAILFAMPGVFRHISAPRHGALPALALYAGWWVVGALPVLATLLLRGWPWIRFRRVVRLFVIFAFASVALHLALENWVYKVRWYDANLAPLALGLALAFGLHDKHVFSLAMRMRLQLALPVAAVALSVGFPSALMFPLHGISMSPLRLVFLAAVIVYVHGLFTYRHMYFLLATAGCFAAAGLGVSLPAIVQSVQTGWSSVVDVGRRLIPRTSTHWGVLSVVASFLLLVLGAIASVMKARQAHSAIAIAPTLLPGGGEDRFDDDQLMV
jgi:hypothetical protein